MSTYNAVMNCKWLGNPPPLHTDPVQKSICSCTRPIQQELLLLVSEFHIKLKNYDGYFFKKPFLEWSLYISLLFTVANLKFILMYQMVCYRSKEIHHISQAAPLTLHFKKKYWTLQSFSSFPPGVSDALRLCSEWRIQTLAAHKVYCMSLRLWSLTPQQTHSRGQIHTGEMEPGDILVLELQASLPKNKQQQKYQTKQKTQHCKLTILQ